MKSRLFGWFSAQDVIEKSAHEALMAEKDARISALLDQLQQSYLAGKEWRMVARDAQAHIADLTKPAVAVISPPTLTLEPKPPSLIAQAIREMAQGDTRLSAHLHQQKRELREKHPHMSDDAIIQQLCRWETSEEMLDAEATG